MRGSIRVETCHKFSTAVGVRQSVVEERNRQAWHLTARVLQACTPSLHVQCYIAAPDSRLSCRSTIVWHTPPHSTALRALTTDSEAAVVSSPSAHRGAVLLVGFPANEADLLFEQLEAAVEHCQRFAANELHPESRPADLLSSSHCVSLGAVAGGQLGRQVLLLGPGQQLGLQVRLAMEHLGCAPAILAAVPEQQLRQDLVTIAAGMRQAHARHYQLYQPLRTSVAESLLPAGAVVTMNLVLDQGQVPLSDGSGSRTDASHLLVLDGLCSGAERQQLLDWLTEAGWQHERGPPPERWELSCADREGDVATWGIRRHVLQALRDDPPPALVAVQSRLAALYPDFDIGYMPAEALQDPDDDAMGLSPFVANAVLHTDVPSWHTDADPSTLEETTPWLEHYSWYTNREPGKPLFVSMLMYLDEEWPEAFDAETLFLDPETGTGVFVRPAPGRITLMDQDVPHRISVPSPSAGRPRYSLVWKLVFYPKQGCQQSTLARPEWGVPVRFGSAGNTGVPLSRH